MWLQKYDELHDYLGVASIDKHGIILRCNEEYAIIMGDTVAEVIGTSVIERIAPKDRQVSLENLQALVSGATTRVLRTKRYLRASGELIFCRMLALRESGDEVLINTWVYRVHVSAEYVDRTEELLLSILKASERGVRVTMNDNSQTADRGGRNSMSINTYAVVAAIVLAIVIAAVAIFGGSLIAKGGGAEIEVTAPE